MHGITAYTAGMNIEDLYLFRDVTRRLSFAAVALERELDPTSVSRAVANLEKELGARLFQRTTRRMTLTEAGRILLGSANTIIEAVEQARDGLRDARTGPTGCLRMTASTAFGEAVIAPLLGDFLAQYPALTVELQLTDSRVDYVSDGIDLGVRLGSQLSGEMVATQLFRTRYRVCASPEYLNSVPAIRRPEHLHAHFCPVMTQTAFRSQWRFRDSKGRERRVDIKSRLAVTSALSLRRAALEGLGPALLPEWLVGTDLKSGALKAILPGFQVSGENVDTAAWLIYPSRSYLPQKVRVMIDFLKSRLG